MNEKHHEETSDRGTQTSTFYKTNDLFSTQTNICVVCVHQGQETRQNEALFEVKQK